MMITQIGFKNGRREDETEFDTTDEQEVANLWFEFCQEEGIIEYIDVVDNGNGTYQYRPDDFALWTKTKRIVEIISKTLEMTAPSELDGQYFLWYNVPADLADSVPTALKNAGIDADVLDLMFDDQFDD